MLQMLHQQATNKRRRAVPNRPNNRSPEMPPVKSRLPRRGIIRPRSHPAVVSDHLTRNNQQSKSQRKPQSHHAVKPQRNSKSPQRRKKRLPRQRIMIPAPRRTMQLNRHADPRSDARSQPKKKPQPQCVPDPKYNRISHRSRKQSQRPMLPAQQVISQIKRPKHIQKRPGNTNARDNVVIHRAIVMESPTSPNARIKFFTSSVYLNVSQKPLPFACTIFHLVLK